MTIERVDVCTYGCSICLGTSVIRVDEVNPARTVPTEDAQRVAAHHLQVLKNYVATDEFALIVNALSGTFLRMWVGDLKRLKKEVLSPEGLSPELLTLWADRISKLAYYGDWLVRHADLKVRRGTWDEGITILEDAIDKAWAVSGLELQHPQRLSS